MTTDKFRPMPVFSEKQIASFWKKVKICEDDQCWPWMRYREPFGYGQVGVPGYKVFLAHRVAYFLHTGIDPGPNCVLHRCDNPPCCNPNHHFLGSRGENTKDMLSKKRHKTFIPEYIHKGITAIDVTFMREMFWCGDFSQSHIARAYKMPIPTAARVIIGRARKDIPMPIEAETNKHLLGARSGSRNCRSLIGIYENDVFLMREMYCLARIPAKKIGEWYGLSVYTAYSIVSGNSWKHVPFPLGGHPKMMSPRRRVAT